jgi:hypothetical protein
MERKKILVADSAFISTTFSEDYDLVNIFPMRENDGAYRSNLSDLVYRSKQLSKFYNLILPHFIEAFQSNYKFNDIDPSTIIRPCLITITSLFVDRYIRVSHRLKSNGKNVYVPNVNEIKEIQFFSHIYSDSNSNWLLNQTIINKIASALGVKTQKKLNKINGEFPEYPKIKNLSFHPFKETNQIIKRIKNRIFFMFSNLFFNGEKHILSLGLGYDDSYLIERGIYFFNGLLKKFTPPNMLGGKANVRKRKAIKNKVKPEVRHFFNNLILTLKPEISTSELNILYKVWLNLICDWFPTSFIESLATNVGSFKDCRKLKKSKAIIGVEFCEDSKWLVAAFAKKNGINIVGVQHSPAYYGYINDLSLMAQFEYSLYDIMLTFGWNKFQRHLPSCQTIAIPSPRLSCFPLSSNYLLKSRFTNKQTKDILFMPSNFNRFPHISTCGQPRVDFLDDVFRSHFKLISQLTDFNFSVDLKSFHKKFMDLYPQYLQEIKKIGGERLNILDLQQKGLQIDFIKKYRIVVWDTLGTGAIDCLSSKVPTMIFWKKIYGRENSFARNLIKDLELSGVIHTTPTSLVKEILKFKKNPKLWMQNKKRVDSVNAFLRQFASSDNKWLERWENSISIINKSSQ